MKKAIHPIQSKTIIKMRDGSTYVKKWLYFKFFLPLETDISWNKKWKKNISSNINMENKNQLKKLKI